VIVPNQLPRRSSFQPFSQLRRSGAADRDNETEQGIFLATLNGNLVDAEGQAFAERGK
jgi:hypothetical protein